MPTHSKYLVVFIEAKKPEWIGRPECKEPFDVESMLSWGRTSKRTQWNFVHCFVRLWISLNYKNTYKSISINSSSNKTEIMTHEMSTNIISIFPLGRREVFHSIEFSRPFLARIGLHLSTLVERIIRAISAVAVLFYWWISFLVWRFDRASVRWAIDAC